MSPAAAAPTLRPYQEQGVAFLTARKRAILGDEMGLGKTPQALVALSRLFASRPACPSGATRKALIVAPAATLPGLAREVLRWTGLTATVLDAAGKVAVPQADGITLIAWTSLAKRSADLLVGTPYLAVVMDESHKIKNPKAAVTAAALGKWKKVDGAWMRSPSIATHCEYLWAMTGTPIPNRPIEMQPLLHLGLGQRWASYAAFGNAYCKQANRFAPQGFDYLGARNLGSLGQELAPIMLRRTADMVPGELPALTVQTVPLDGVKEPKSAKALDAQALAAAVGEGKTLPFEEISKYRAEMGAAKVPVVVSWVEEWLEENEGKALVLFAHHRQVVEDLASALGAAGHETIRAHGDHTPEQRQESVDAFAVGAGRVFIGTIGACGTGLNGLHRRTTVCAFAELPWTPGELTQAIGRVRRFGSANNHAQAFILVGADSLEDHMVQVIAGKVQVAGEALAPVEAQPVPAAAPVAIAEAPAVPATAAEQPAPSPEAPETGWTWAKLRDGSWGVRFGAAGNPIWVGSRVEVSARAGGTKPALLGPRVASGRDWSLWHAEPVKDTNTWLAKRAEWRGLPFDGKPVPAERAEQLAWAHRSCGVLSALDRDGASIKNQEGWNKADGAIGKGLAAHEPAQWRVGTLDLALAILKKYHAQIGTCPP
jgi:SWI/SNF-related matrix-associated actin-dependent regulator 1 of chromatin subfamily A